MSLSLLAEAVAILGKSDVSNENYARAHALVIESLAHLTEERFQRLRQLEAPEPGTPGKTVNQVIGKRRCPDAPPRGVLHARHEDTSRGAEDGYVGASQVGTPSKRARTMNVSESDAGTESDDDDAGSEHTAPVSRPAPAESQFLASQDPQEG